MFNVKKNKPPRSIFSYTDNDIRHKVREEFYGLCYICECFPSQNFQIEHFYSQKYYPEKVNEWDNLFHVCPTCNSIKGSEYNSTAKEIFNCCIDDVEKSVRLSYNKKSHKIEIKTLDDDVKSLNTKELLNRIYNGEENTKSDGYKYIQEIIIEELRKLEEELRKIKNVKNKNLIAGKLKIVRKMLSRKNMTTDSSYVSFKLDLVEKKHPQILKMI